jgi:hypothetical protein
MLFFTQITVPSLSPFEKQTIGQPKIFWPQILNSSPTPGKSPTLFLPYFYAREICRGAVARMKLKKM